jgi:hypothetical protein
MRCTIILAIGLLVFPLTAWSCINAVGTTSQGQVFNPMFEVGDALRNDLTRDESHSNYVVHARTFIDAARKQPNFESLTDLAMLHLAGGSIENANVLYDLAVKYGATQTPLMLARQRFIHDELARPRKPNAYNPNCPICEPIEPPPVPEPPSYVSPPGSK